MNVQLLVEIDDVAVGVALSQNRDEAEYVALESETLGVRLQITLGRHLGGRVERRLDRKGGIFRGGKNLGLAIPRSGRRHGDSNEALAPHGLEHVDRCDGVLPEVAQGMR